MSGPDPLELRQACLDLSKAALDLCDRFEEHGLEAAWVDGGAATVLKMQNAHETLRSFLSHQAASRLRALGVPLR